MTTTLSPAPHDQPRVDSPEGLEALIEEARKRARRRRRWYAASALLAAGAAASAFAGYHSGGRGSSAGPRPASERPNANAAIGASASRATSAIPHNGPVTILTDTGTVSAVLPPGRVGTVFRCNCELASIASIDWAPDGKRLAFAASTVSRWSPFNGIYVRNMATGKDRHLARFGSDLDWSADGRRLAYVEGAFGDPQGTITVINARTARRERSIQTGTEGRDSSPSWSPGGDRLVFASLDNGSTISVITLKGSRRTLLARGASAPAWSPRGDKIAYRTHCGIKLVTPTGRDVTPGRGRRCSAIGVVGRPFWSPDGHKIGIQTRRGIYSMNPDGSGFGLLTWETGFGPFDSGLPSWRPQSPSRPRSHVNLGRP